MSFPTAYKSFGQHFLHCQKTIHTITSDFKEDDDAILEIGPGPGILTKLLAHKSRPFKVIEKDSRFLEVLKKYLPQDCIYCQDALAFDLEDFLKEWKWQNKKIWLVSNLPYNISAPLFIKFIQYPSIHHMTLMFQKEVAEKMLSPKAFQKNNMNSLMAIAQTYFKIQLLEKVSPGAFSPPPQVESVVLSFQRIYNPVIPLEHFSFYESFLRTLFQFKRKQIGKVLQSFVISQKICSLLRHLEIESSKRAESFQLEEIQLLYKEVMSCQMARE